MDRDTLVQAIRATFDAMKGRAGGWSSDRRRAADPEATPGLDLVRGFADEVVRAAEAIEARDEAVAERIARVLTEDAAAPTSETEDGGRSGVGPGREPTPRPEESSRAGEARAERGDEVPPAPVPGLDGPEDEPFEPDPDPWRPLDDEV